MESVEIHHIRESFPALKTKIHGKDLVYFDNAASTLKHLSVLKELDQHYYHETANIHRGVHYLSKLGTQKYERTRDIIQKFINETYHIENEFICQLDPSKFDMIPEYVIVECDKLVSGDTT